MRQPVDTYGILRVGHSVERTETHGELVDNEVVSVVLGLDESSKTLLVLGAEKLTSALRCFLCSVYDLT